MINSSKDIRSFQFPVLVADIGGTNTRFALVTDAHADIQTFDAVKTNAYDSLGDAISDTVLNHTALLPRTAVVAVAGPVHGDEIPMTNANWVIEPKKLIEELGLNAVVVLNDFEAQALALPTLDEADLTQIGGGEAIRHAPKCVIGPGTGLGAASLFHAADFWVPVAGEGGHVEVGPINEEEETVWAELRKKERRIGAEVILSGGGLLRLAAAVSDAQGIKTTYSKPSDVTDAADAGDELARKVLHIFANVLGRVAGDMALILLARGGVYLAGGIPPQIRNYLMDGSLRAGFENKAPHEAIMKEIPVYLVHHERPALQGLAALARTPARFAVDLVGRMWQSESPR
ncbi:MAG: glucokinase [Stappiaceae bacterium]